MYSFGKEMVIEGDITAIWQAVTDAAAWPNWDPHEEGPARRPLRARHEGLEQAQRRARGHLRDHRGRAGADVVGTGLDPVRQPARR